MTDFADFWQLSPTTLADVLSRDQVMDYGIRPLWSGMLRIAGPAYTVQCAPGDNLMVHAAVYLAPPGSILVVKAGDLNYAVAGGNLGAIAQQRGIAALVVDGVIRDLGDMRERGFPVFARGVRPISGSKKYLGPFNTPIKCGGVHVQSGDIIVADEEGVVVVPEAQSAALLVKAQMHAAQHKEVSLEEWSQRHRQRIERILRTKRLQTLAPANN